MAKGILISALKVLKEVAAKFDVKVDELTATQIEKYLSTNDR